MPSKYVTQELFDERTGNMSQTLGEVKTHIASLDDKIDKLNSWKLKVVVGATILSGIVTVAWQLLIHKEAIAAVLKCIQ